MTPPDCSSPITPCKMTERVTAVETIVKSLNKDVNGNGTPGKMDNLRADLKEVKEAMNARFAIIEDRLGRLNLIIGVVAGAAGLGAKEIFKLLTGG
jgi:hypothetical protein